ncbi:MAG: T9SS type A sorting domain-containing protein [Saprospiraceae bacterium]|nr:T9SS type A sorting domain-containing protein [Saprospiraceae bacterium]
MFLPENMAEETTVLLYSPTGQLVRSETMNSGANSLDVKDLAAGIYCLMVWNSTAWLFEKLWCKIERIGNAV